MTDGQPILRGRGLVKRYGRVTALDHADFDLLPGETVRVELHSPKALVLASVIADQFGFAVANVTIPLSVRTGALQQVLGYEIAQVLLCARSGERP